MSLLNSIDTKLQAYKLVHDPTRLLMLLYSKYGDIEEDLNFLYINQILYNRPSHYNTIFKEFQYILFIDEFLKRYYFYQESILRIPKLNDYYKNYHIFFCRPIFRNWKISELMHNYGDNRAEVFYKKNYATSNEEEEERESSNETSLSSLDNITDNKNIFNKKTRYMIDNNTNSNKCTLTLDSSRTLKSNLNLLTKRSKDDSFVKNISPLVNYQGNFGPKKKKDKNENKTTSNIHNKKNPKHNIKNRLIYKKDLKKNKNIKSTLYSLVKNDLIENGKNNQKKVFLSPKLKPYLSNYKSNLDDFNKNKGKTEKLTNGVEKSKNITYNNNINNNVNMNSNYRNFSKLSITLNTNNNNMNFSKTMRNSNITSNNNTNVKNSINNINGSNSNSKRNNKIPNGINNIYHSSVHSTGNTIQKSKNKTFDIQNINSMNTLTKVNSNSNFSSFNYQQNSVRHKRKSSYGSNFNLVKSPLTSIQSNLNGAPILSQKNTNFPKNKTYNNHNNSKNSIITPSSSIPKYSCKKEKKKKSYNKEKGNNLYKKKNNGSYNNTINLNNFIFPSQRTSSNTSNKKSNNNILSNNINSNRMIMNLNNIYNNSRNKKNMITHTQTNLKSFRKDAIVYKTKSVDEEKTKLKYILFGINKNSNNYQMSQRLQNQIEELIKKSKISLKHSNGLNNISNNFYNGNEKLSKKSIIENSNISIPNNYSGSNISCRRNSNKGINVNLNVRTNSEERKKKIIRIISPKK